MTLILMIFLYFCDFLLPDSPLLFCFVSLQEYTEEFREISTRKRNQIPDGNITLINQRTVGDDLPVRNTPLSLRDLTETKIMAEGLLLTSSYHSPAPSDIVVISSLSNSLSMSILQFTLFTQRIILLTLLIHVSSVFIFHKYLKNFLPGLHFTI